MTKTSDSKPIWPVFALFICLSLGVFYFGVTGFYKAAASKSWPTAAGTIVSSDETSTSGKRTRFGLDINYSYTVAGRKYQSKYFKETAIRGTPEWNQQIKQYSASSRVTVYHNPKDPRDSVIEPGPKRDHYVMTLAPLLVIALLVVAYVQQPKKQ